MSLILAIDHDQAHVMMRATEAAQLWRLVNGTRGDENRIISMPVRPETAAIVRKVLEEIVGQPNVTLARAARIGLGKDHLMEGIDILG